MGKDSLISSPVGRQGHVRAPRGSWLHVAAPGVVVVTHGCERRAATAGISVLQLLLMKRFDGGNFQIVFSSLILVYSESEFG